MTIISPPGRLHSHTEGHVPGPLLALTGAIAAVVVVAAMYGQALTPDALVPVTSMTFFVLAAAIALVAWRRPQPKRQFSYWDAAGILTFIGIAMGATVEPDQMVGLVAGTARP
jgi:drug/metabolite transporter (DMT)-like permease